MASTATRLRRGLLAAALVLVGATAVRGARLVGARPATEVVVRSVEVERLAGGLLVEARDGGWSVRRVGSQKTLTLASGESGSLGGVHFELVGGPDQRVREVLRVPWSVFAGRKDGHRRIDFGSDPLGRVDGVRDRVVLPGAEGVSGWFHLEPLEGVHFTPDQRGARLVVEREGLELVDSGLLEPGEDVPVGSSFRLRGDGLELEVRWQDVSRASVVEGSDGRVAGYGPDRVSVDFVVAAREPGQGAEQPVLVLLDGDGGVIERAPVSTTAPTLVHGRRDRISALGGRVLPPSARDERLEQAVSAGLAEGWIAIDGQRARVVLPEGKREGVDRPLLRSVVDLVGRYDEARSPMALRLGAGSRSSSAAAGGAPLRYSKRLDAFTPSVPLDGDVVFVLPVEGELIEVSASVPASWRRHGKTAWTALPEPAPGSWRTWELAAADAVEVQLRAPRVLPTPDAFSVAIVGAPDWTFLDAPSLRWSTRAFDGWERRGAAGDRTASRGWHALDGDRWSARGDAPDPARQRPRPLFVRIPVDATQAGWLALDVALPARVVAASWNDEPWTHASLPRDGGLARLSLKTVEGRNLLALQLEMPASAPPQESGGVRFLSDAEGAPEALDPSVADRRMRGAVRAARRLGRALGPEAPPSVLVERGLPGLAAGTRWQVAPAADRPGRSTLVIAQSSGTLRRNDFGRLELGAEGIDWANGDRLALTGVSRDRPATPASSVRLPPGHRQRLLESGDALRAEEFQLRALPTRRDRLRGALLVLRGGLHALQTRGTPRWHRDPDPEGVAGLRVALISDGEELRFAASEPGVLWSATGKKTKVPATAFDAADEPASAGTPWPPGARLVLKGTELRLRRPLEAADADLPAWAQSSTSTVDPGLQVAAQAALDAQLDRVPPPAGDTEALAGVLLALDARSGDVLACASRERPDGEPSSHLVHPCWQDGGFHPGSTFKIATASAGLKSSDPAIARMLNGDLPAGLRRSARSSLDRAKLPPAGSATKERALASRLRNFRGRETPIDTDLEDALRSSLNTWFGYLGLMLHRPLREGWGQAAIALSDDREAQWPVEAVARSAGFGRRIDLGGGFFGGGGSFPSAAAPSDAVLAARSVGQGEVTATPLGVAGLVAMALERGEAAEPRIRTDRPVERSQRLEKQSSDRLRGALLDVVRKGTARAAFADNPHKDRVLGKTGSAQRRDRNGLQRTDAWFAGAVLGPSDKAAPVVVVCLLPGAGLGGQTAAEVVDQFSRDVVLVRGWDEDRPLHARR